MHHLRACWRLLRLCWHIAAGLATVGLRFPHLSEMQRQQRVQTWSQALLRHAGIALQLQGQPAAPGPVLLVANHISWLDIPVLHAACYCRFVAKADVARWPLVGMLANAAGTLYIQRESPRDALRVVHHMAEALQADHRLAVFPEGTTSDGLGLLPFHANLLQAAISAQASIQPVGLSFIDRASGKISIAPSYVGDESLLGSLWRTLCAPPLVARLQFGFAQQSLGRTRQVWAADLYTEVHRLRGELH